MRRTLISYSSFYTQQGTGPVQCHMTASSRVDPRSCGQACSGQPSPFLASTIFCYQPTTSATTPQTKYSQLATIFIAASALVNPFTLPLSQLKPPPDANIQICTVPTIQICPGAIVEVSASLPGDAPVGQSGFNSPFWFTRPASRLLWNLVLYVFQCCTLPSRQWDILNGIFGKFFPNCCN